MLTELFELMISIWIMVMFFKFLGFVPILAGAGVIWLIVRLVNPSQSEHV